VNKLKFDENISKESISFIKGLLKIDPEERLSWEEAFNHQLFKKEHKFKHIYQINKRR